MADPTRDCAIAQTLCPHRTISTVEPVDYWQLASVIHSLLVWYSTKNSFFIGMVLHKERSCRYGVNLWITDVDWLPLSAPHPPWLRKKCADSFVHIFLDCICAISRDRRRCNRRNRRNRRRLSLLQASISEHGWEGGPTAGSRGRGM